MSTLPTGTAGQAVIDAARNFALTGEGFDAMCRAIEAYETSPVEQPRTYTTQPGESVMGIALRQCGNEMEWRHILASNPKFASMLPHEYFPVGTVLTLPPPPAVASPAPAPADERAAFVKFWREVDEMDPEETAQAAFTAGVVFARAASAKETAAEGPAELPRFPLVLRKMWSATDVQQWLDDRIAPRFKVLRNALEHIAATARRSRSQSRRLRWIELRALGALNGTDEWRTVDLPKNGEGVRRRLVHEIAERDALIQALQKALAYWMPKVFDERSEHDAYLLVGYQGETEESWGEKAQAELERLNAIINTPHTDDFLKSVSIEAEHQRQRWDDSGKTPADWFWLVGYLAGKALNALIAGDQDKAEHHVITTAAALANWYRVLRGAGPCETGEVAA